jgi:hypothetical protein
MYFQSWLFLLSIQKERAALPADRAALLLESGNLLRKVPVV